MSPSLEHMHVALPLRTPFWGRQHSDRICGLARRGTDRASCMRDRTAGVVAVGSWEWAGLLSSAHFGGVVRDVSSGRAHQ